MAGVVYHMPRWHPPEDSDSISVSLLRLTQVTEKNIEKRVWIQASAEVVFHALTRARALKLWFCDKASSNPCVEGELVAHWIEEKNKWKGRAIFTRFEPPYGLTLRWLDDGGGVDAAAAHIINYDIHPKAGMTELVMTDSDETEIDEETLDYLARGWNAVLLELKDYCENRERATKNHSAV